MVRYLIAFGVFLLVILGITVALARHVRLGFRDDTDHTDGTPL